MEEYVWPVKEDGERCPRPGDFDGVPHTFVTSKTNRHFEGSETETVTVLWTCQHCLVVVNGAGKIVRKPGQP